MDTIEKEKIYVHEEDDGKEYASKGTGNAGLTLGIIGTALAGLLWAKNGNSFGFGSSCGNPNMPNGVNAPTAYQVEQKECNDVVALTNAFWQARVTGMNERFNDRQVINAEMFGLYRSQIDSDFLLYKGQRDTKDDLLEKINAVNTKVDMMAAVRPYQDKLIQCQIMDARKDAEFDLYRKTCRMITGEVVLPNTPIVSGYQSAQRCCNQVQPQPAE